MQPETSQQHSLPHSRLQGTSRPGNIPTWSLRAIIAGYAIGLLYVGLGLMQAPRLVRGLLSETSPNFAKEVPMKSAIKTAHQVCSTEWQR